LIAEMLRFLASGGPIMIPIAVVSIALWYLIAGRAIAVAFARRSGHISRVDETTLRSGISVIHALIATAPLLGLLGTIHGIVIAFDVLTLSGGAPAQELSGGIAQALITTEAGLGVAVPALFAIRSIESRLRRIRERLDRAEGGAP